MIKKGVLILVILAMLPGYAGCAGRNLDSASETDTYVEEIQTTETTGITDTEQLVTEPVTTEALAAWETPVDFEWNPHVFGETMCSIFGDDGEQDFYTMVDAVMAGEETFTYRNEMVMWNLDLLSAFLFPPYWVLVSEIAFENGTATITYKVDAAERERILSEFGERIIQLVEADVMENDNEIMKSIALYHDYCRRVNYDYEFAEDVSTYRAIMEYGGICQSFAGAYAYLCQQCGIDAVPITGVSGDVAHEWTLVNLEGEYYHMDLTFENGLGAEGLRYYGMTTMQRECDGYLIQDFNVMNEWWGEDVVATDDRFEPLWTISRIVEIVRSEQGMEIVGEDYGGNITSYVIQR